MQQKLLTPKELMNIFNCGRNEAYAIMHSAGFPRITIGKRLYVLSESLERWLKAYEGRSISIA